MQQDATPTGASEYVLEARLAHIRGMLGVLQTIKQTKKQMATLLADQHGLKVYTYDDSRVMQGCAHFRREVFNEYAFTAHDGSLRKCFSTSLSNLVDSLAVCAGSDGVAELTLKWPDQDGRLLLQVNAVRDTDEEGGIVESCTYAEISCQAANFAEDMEGEMTQPRSQFTLPCSTLRELVDDMDWAGAPVCLTMRREPAALSFAAHGAVVGDLRVDVDTGRASSALHSFDCAADGMASTYKFKFLRAATCMPPALMGSTDGENAGVSRVQMDAQGLLKVQHLLHIAKAPSGGGGDGGGGHAYGHPRATGASMDSVADPPASYPGPYTGGTAGGGGSEHGGSVLVPVTFVLFPEEAQANGEPDEADGGDQQPAGRGAAATHGSPVL